jgi:hypothetical protein
MKRNLTLILLLFFIVIGCRQNKQTERLKFNRGEWLHGDIRTRGKMVDYIIEDSILIGKSKSEVLSLLGDQGETNGNFSYPVDIGKTTGPFGWGGIWPFDLNIHFDTLSNKAIEVRCND